MTQTPQTAPQPVPETPAQALAALRSNREAASRVEVERYRLTCEYVAMNLVDHDSGDVVVVDMQGGPSRLDVLLAGEGAPHVAEFAVLDYAATLGMTTTSGKLYVGAVMAATGSPKPMRPRWPAGCRGPGPG